MLSWGFQGPPGEGSMFLVVFQGPHGEGSIDSDP